MAVLLLWTGQSPLTTDVDRNSAFDFNSSCAANFSATRIHCCGLIPVKAAAAAPLDHTRLPASHRPVIVQLFFLQRCCGALLVHIPKKAPSKAKPISIEVKLRRGCLTALRARFEGEESPTDPPPLSDASLQLDLNCRHHVADDLRIRPLVDERQAYFQIVCLRPL
jgi:hypothetical protein